jgi:SHS2 domain-containing protein
MTVTPKRWRPKDRAAAYRELEHPADLFLEIRGHDLPELVEHALFALYDEIADLERFETRGELTLRVSESELDEALRSLLSEALYYIDTRGFVATAAEIQIEQAAPVGWTLVARLWGEHADRERHPLLTEIKAVTYHQLRVEQVLGGSWRATVLLDV